MTIREISAIKLPGVRGRRIEQRQATCDACGATTGLMAAHRLSFAGAKDWLRQHRADCSGGPPRTTEIKVFLLRLIEERDHHAEVGEYTGKNFNPKEQGYDDWAADTAQSLLARYVRKDTP
jgi:hypothetical protein